MHFLRDEGFVTDNVHDDILTPRSTLTEAERAGELVKWIKNRVKQDPRSFHLLLNYFRQRGALYKPIVSELSVTIVAFGADYGGSFPSYSFQLTHELKLGAEKRETASDLTGSQPSLPSSPPVSRRQPGETTPEPLSPSSQLAIVQTPQPPETYQQVDRYGEYFSVWHVYAPVITYYFCGNHGQWPLPMKIMFLHLCGHATLDPRYSKLLKSIRVSENYGLVHFEWIVIWFPFNVHQYSSWLKACCVLVAS